MAQRLSREELFDLTAQEGELKDAILNPTTNLETFSNVVGRASTGALSNLNNLLGNVISSAKNQEDSNVYRQFRDVLRNRDLSSPEKVLGLLKTPFTDTEEGPVDYLLGIEGGTSKVHELFNKEREEFQKKADLGKQYAGGGLGEFLGETLAMAPIMKFGSMSMTNNALKLGLKPVDVAKSIAVDTARNAGVLGSTEFLLNKAYGRNDEEAMINAAMATGVGALGTPLVGGAKTLIKSIKAPEEALRKNFEEGGSMAGGGKPPEFTTKSDDVKESIRESEKVEFDVVEPKAKVGKELEGQVDVPEVKNVKKFKKKLGVTGRVFDKDGNLMSVQGTSDRKASLKLRPKEKVTDIDSEVERLTKIYDNDQELKKAYGQTQTKFKNKSQLSKQEELINRNNFIKEQYLYLSKDKSLSNDLRLKARQKFKELRDSNIKIQKPSDEIIQQAEKKFAEQFNFKKPSNLKAREADARSEYDAYVKSVGKEPKGTLDLSSNKDVSKLSDNISKTIDKNKFAKAIDSVETKEKLAGRNFDYGNITNSQRNKYPDEIADIEDYTNSVIDLNLFKTGKLTPEQLRFRAKRRLDEKFKREDLRTKDDIEAGNKEPLTKEEANRAIQERVDAYNDIGVYVRKTDVEIEKGKKLSKGGIPKEKDRSEELAKASKMHDMFMKNISRYRKTGIRERRTVKEGDRGGQYKLSDKVVKDIEDGILTNKEIADKYAPNVLPELRDEAIKKAREVANKKVNLARAKKLGITKDTKLGEPSDIVFKDNIYDAKNSMIQMAGVLIGNKKLFGSFETIREDIGEQMAKNGFAKPIVMSEGSEKTWKDLIKPLFMTKGYGQGDKGLIKDLMDENKFTKEYATEFLNAYNKAESDLIPELKNLQDLIQSRVKKGETFELGWTLPDGFEVKLNLEGKLNGTYSIKGNKIPITLRSGSIDELSRAVMPNVIHSLDAYVARQMNKSGIPTIHDAAVIPKGYETKVKEVYDKALIEINKGKVLDEVLTKLGLSKDKLPKRDLTAEDISSTKTLGVEHKAGEIIKPKKREFDISKANSDEEVMRDFMASNSVRNVRTSQMVDTLVNEASYRTMSKAREGDDVFERQVALAHQTSIYKPNLSIKAPSGVDLDMWNKVQKEIFNEARAKLEYNPLLRNILRGKRQYFDRNGKIIGNERKTIDELIQSENRTSKKLLKSLNKNDKDIVDSYGSNIKQKVFKWSKNKPLREEEIVAKNHVVNSMSPSETSITKKDVDFAKKYSEQNINIRKIEKEEVKQGDYTWSFISKQFDADEAYKEFLKFKSINDASENKVQFNAEQVHKEFTQMMKGEDLQEWGDKVFRTNMHNVMNETKESADYFWNNYKHIYNRPDAKQMIDAMARSFGDNSKKYGAYLNNGSLIAKELNLSPKFAPIITKLASIKAMNDKKGAWEFLEMNRDTEHFRLAMEIITNIRTLSRHNFQRNPEKFIDGFVVENYEGYKQILDQKVIWNAEQIRDKGAIASDEENAVMGTLTDKMYSKVKMSDFKTRQDAIDFAEEHNLKIGDKGFFRIQQLGELRDEAGRDTNFIEMLINTMHDTQMKFAETEVAKRQMDFIVNEKSSLFSNEPKDGFIKITEKQKSSIVPSLRDSVNYIHKDYLHRILGRDEVRLVREGKDTPGANQTMKVVDRLWKDFFTNAKQNMVLKNISSFKNAFFGSVALNLLTGATPKSLYKSYGEAVSQMRQIDNLVSKRAMLKASGKSTKTIDDKLNKIPLYQMEQAGLAINQLDGVRGKSSFLYHMLSDNIGGRIDKMLGTDSVQPFFDKVVNNVAFNQGTYLGDKSAKLFSAIDTQSRYAAASEFMRQGMSLEDAVAKANGLYSDMSQMAPAWIEAIDNYGGVLFGRWASTVIPGIARLSKDNPKKAIAMTIAIYGLSVETDTNLDSVNPVATMVDFVDSALTPDYIQSVYSLGAYEATTRRLASYTIPGILRDIDRINSDIGDEYIFRHGVKTQPYNPLFKDRINAPWSEDALDYRGLTSRVGDSILNIDKE